MAIINYVDPPAKGATTTAIMDKAELLALTPVAADAYWSDGNNTQTVIVVMKSTTGNQKRVLTFDFAQGSPSTSLSFPTRCRDNFAISKITMIDYLGDKLNVLAAAVDFSADNIAL